MTEVEHLADVFEDSFSGDAWHGPSLMAILKDVDARKAAARRLRRITSGKRRGETSPFETEKP